MHSTKTLIFSVLIIGVIMLVAGRLLWDGDDVDNPDANPSPTASATFLPARSPMSFTVRLTASGPVPKTLTIRAGDMVTLVDEDTQGFAPRSDTCPGFDSLRTLMPTERYALTFNDRRTCTYHDNQQPSATARQGTIIVQ